MRALAGIEPGLHHLGGFSERCCQGNGIEDNYSKMLDPAMRGLHSWVAVTEVGCASLGLAYSPSRTYGPKEARVVISVALRRRGQYGRSVLAVYGALVLVQVLFGLWPVAAASVLSEVSPAALIGFRTLVATPLMFLLIPSARHPRRPQELVQLAGLGLLGIAANQLLFVEGLRRAGPINAVILVNIIPILTLVVAVILGRERLEPRKTLGVAVATIGVWLLVGAQRLDADSRNLMGMLFLLGNTTCYALYLVLAKRVVVAVGPLTAVAWIFLFGAVWALPFTGSPFVSTPWLDLSSATWVGLTFILVGPTFGTYFLNAYALRRADSSVVAVFIGLQPVVGALGAWVVLGEVVTPRASLAALLIVGGVVVSAARKPASKDTISFALHRPR